MLEARQMIFPWHCLQGTHMLWMSSTGSAGYGSTWKVKALAAFQCWWCDARELQILYNVPSTTSSVL